MELAVPEARYAGELCRDRRLRPQKWTAQRRLHPGPCHSSRFTGCSEGEVAMRAWPDLTEYHEAVQHPPKAFADPGLRAVTLELDRFGMPKPATGGNAVVYKANEPGGLLSFKKTWAIRCFLRPISDHAERYEAISKHLRKVRLPYDVNFQFLKHGNILVRGGSIQLVDYDGMWVPALRGRHATEIGHRAYQHPERSEQDYGQ